MPSPVRPRLLAPLLVLVLGPVLGLAPAIVRAADDPAEAGAELDRIRKEIRAVEQRVRQDTARRSTLDRDLRAAEEAAGQARRNLAKLREELAATRREQARLEAAAAQARSDLDRQRESLAAHLRLAHRTGPGARLETLLSDGDPGDLGRRLQYLSYLARSRQQAVVAVQASLEALALSQAEVDAKAGELARLEEKQAAEVASLEKSRKERAAVLARVDREVKGSDARLKRLRSEAEALERLVRELERAIAREEPKRRAPPQGSVPGDGKTLPKGRWPVDGRLLADYGQPRAGGQMRWDGVLIGAPAGTAVRATRAGRVVYADWLPGMGLLMVLDHGQGILSLYGHNQELTREVGERVQAGDTIARVGDTGGQGRPAVYFEVRRNGKPDNPHRWVR
jgi:septal ring factor EnvC (AmiA/AmiB activator)